MESGAFKALKVQADYFRSDIDAQRQKTDQAMRDLEELRSKRREFEAKIVDEQSTRANALEKDLKRVSNDLARIRTMRDQLQAALGVEKAKNVKDESASADLRLSVSTNKERMRCLVEDVRRMKVRMAACSGDERLFKDVLFACELELAATSSSVDELNTEVEVPKIRSLVERLQERADLAEQESSRLRREMEALQGSDGGDDRRIAALAERESQLEQKLKEARERLTKYESVFGDLDAITDGGMESRLVEMQEQIKKMQLKLRSYEQVRRREMHCLTVLVSPYPSPRPRTQPCSRSRVSATPLPLSNPAKVPRPTPSTRKTSKSPACSSKRPSTSKKPMCFTVKKT